MATEPGQPIKTYSGIVLLVLAVAMLLINISDTVKDLQEWHYVSTPQFVAVLMKQIGGVLVAAIGGNLLPTPGSK